MWLLIYVGIEVKPSGFNRGSKEGAGSDTENLWLSHNRARMSVQGEHFVQVGATKCLRGRKMTRLCH